MGFDNLGRCVALASLVFTGSLVAGAPLSIVLFLLSGIVGTGTLLLNRYFVGPAFSNVQNTTVAILLPAVVMIAAFDMPDEARIVTVFALLGVTAVLAGIAMLVIATMGWSRYVQLIPFPVSSGYLAATGALLIVSALRHALAEAGHRAATTVATATLGAMRPEPQGARVYQMDRPSPGARSAAYQAQAPGFAELSDSYSARVVDTPAAPEAPAEVAALPEAAEETAGDETDEAAGDEPAAPAGETPAPAEAAEADEADGPESAPETESASEPDASEGEVAALPDAVSEPEPETDETAETAPEAGSDEATDTDTPAMAPPEFDVVRVDPNGSALIAGHAAPGSDVTVMVEGEKMMTVTADAGGNFVAMFDLPLSDTPRIMQLMAALGGEDMMSDKSVIVEPRDLPVQVAEADTGTPTSEAPPETTEVAPDEVGEAARVMILFDGNDDGAVERAREQWRTMTGAKVVAKYWSQETGRWQLKAESGG